MNNDEMKEMMHAQLEGVRSFIKEAFAVDGIVTTTGKECIIIQPDGEKSKGVTFTAEDSDRGVFMVTLSNPEPMTESSVEEIKKKKDDGSI